MMETVWQCFYSLPPQHKKKKKKQKPSQLGNTQQNQCHSKSVTIYPNPRPSWPPIHPTIHTHRQKEKKKRGSLPILITKQDLSSTLGLFPLLLPMVTQIAQLWKKKSMALGHNRCCCLSTIKWNMKTPKRCFGFCCLYTATWVSIFKFCFVKTPGETRLFFLLGPIPFCFFKTGNLFLNLAIKHPLKLLSSNISKSKLVFYRVLLGLLVC